MTYNNNWNDTRCEWINRIELVIQIQWELNFWIQHNCSVQILIEAKDWDFHN